MSFFNKISDQFDNLDLGGGRKESDRYRDYGYSEQEQQRPSQGQPTYQPPPGRPPLPPGWVPQFDQRYQRWYYAETATGRTQWEAPGQPLPPPQSRDGYNSQGGYEGGDTRGGSSRGGKGGLLLGAAGGLAAGAVGGALLEHALHDSDSDDERRYESAPPPGPPADYGGGYGGGGGYGEDQYDRDYSGYNQGPPGILPPTDADGSSVSSSDREDVEEARDRYEEAEAEANSSDASSSDREEAEEAREEYEEEYEEVYED